jgi:2'-5' RNA ligase
LGRQITIKRRRGIKEVAFNAFSYRLTAVGRFKGSKGDILFINIDSSGRLEALAGSIRKELIKEGFILENK